jgi:flagellar biosynthesis protein
MNNDLAVHKKQVIGLNYSLGSEQAPKVLLKGEGYSAEAILQHAQELEHGPVIVEDKQLLQQLFELPIDAPIGKELYEVIAILLIHIYGIDSSMTSEQHVDLKIDKDFE